MIAIQQGKPKPKNYQRTCLCYTTPRRAKRTKSNK